MRPARTLAAVVVAALAVSGCVTGERPTFAPEPAAVDDPAVLAVVTRLETPNSTQFTASYRIVTKLASQTIPPTAATVSQMSATGRSITIGNVRFLEQDGTQQTCDLATAACPQGFDDAKVSNLLVNHDFYARSAAARLRQDAATMVSAATASTRAIAGQSATCVQVDFAAGSKFYCALDNGLLAYQDAPDVQIDLIGLAAGADPVLFTASAAPG